MATTTGGTTYVTSTDLVADYPTASLALANRVDVVASGGPNSIKTAGYTITLADILGGNKFLYNSASPGTFTLPTSGLVDGMVVNVAQIGAGAVTVAGGTIVGTTATTAQYQGLSFVYASTGTTWYSVAPSVTAAGLTLLTPTSIANSGGSSSLSGGAVTFTGVTSISLNGVFSSTYDTYRVILRLTAASVNNSPTIRLRSSGTDTTANYYYGGTAVSAIGGQVNQIGSNVASFGTGAVSGTYGDFTALSIDVGAPMITARDKTINMILSTHDGTQPFWASIAGALLNTSTAYDGFTYTASTGNVSGVLRVYGYRN